MPTERHTIALGDVAIVRSGYAFKSSDWTTKGIPVVKISNVKHGRLEMASCSYVPEKLAREAGDFNLNTGDILIAMTGYVGDVARVLETDLPVVLNQRVGKFIVRDRSKLDEDFLFQFLSWSDTRKTIESLGYGSAQPNVSPSLIHSVEMPLPTIAEQRSIASVLGALDDKIELNRRMNATLEAMAQAVFKEWFVARNAPGGAKEEWEVKTIGEEFDIVMGQSPPGDTYNESGEGLPFFQGRTDFGFRFPAPRVHCTVPTRLAKEGDTLVSVRAPVGSINMADRDCAIGRGVASIRHKSGACSYTYHLMHSLKTQFELFESGGTVFGSMNKKDFHGIKFQKPRPDRIDAFERLVGPFDERVAINERETRTLAALRDTLLPKLMRGEVRVKTTVNA